ncbi:MAG TPA: hypothetical protein VFA75_00245 [Nevskia sp.]|nr:hypothetical protein [Nevskia sp.]
MKIILSRKGFDSSFGGIPSPILPDGRLLTFPIPSAADAYRFSDLDWPDVDPGPLLSDLSGGRFRLSSRIHLDPDLHRPAAARPPGWRPALGQTGAAQSHLAAQGVGAGDCFLFFGWHREVERGPRGWRYKPRSPHLHLIFGWLEVGEVLPIVGRREACLAEHPWISAHPHLQRPDHYTDPRNTLYVAPPVSRFAPPAAGGGLFRQLRPQCQLTAAGASRSVWQLPAWFRPQGGAPPLTYHANPDLWLADGDHVRLRSVAKGQEFVLHADLYPEAEPWLADLVRSSL